MSLFTRFVRINIAMLIFVSSAFAEVHEDLRNLVLTGDLNGRSSVDFSTKATDSKNNVSAFVPKGTRGTVVEVRKLAKTNSFGIKLKVTELAKKPTNAKNAVTKDQEIWVYFSSTKANWLKFRDVDGSVVQDPEVALTAQAKRDGEALPALPGTLKKPELPTAEEIEREAAQSEDPNLELGKNARNESEGSFCGSFPCLGGQKTSGAKNLSDLDNLKNLEQVEGTLDAMASEPQKNPPKPPVKKEPLPERPISRTPKTEVVDPNNKWSKYPEIMEWSNGKGAAFYKKMSQIKAGGSTGYCARYHKRGLLSAGLVKSYLVAAHARQMTQALLDQNKDPREKNSEYEWVNLLTDPRYKDMIKSPTDVPKNAIMVSWTGESKSSGDMSVKKDWGANPGWISDFYSPRTMMEQPGGRKAARRGKPYVMRGVMVKIKKQR